MNLRKLIVAALMLCMFQTFGQGALQKGYYIDNLDNRIEVFLNTSMSKLMSLLR